MKNSELYYLAQIAIVQSHIVSPENRVALLRLLIEDENLELYREKQEENNETI